ncbi:MAG: PAS domain S-box protein, partial [Geobacteraceae bacterium]|nr:PAS domain S-box protein [Geobacteraceae bacterium]
MFTKNFLPDSNLADDPVYALLESLPEEAVLIDPKGMILSANTLFAARFGISAEECIGANVYDLIATVLQLPELVFHYREKSEEVLRTGKRMVFEDGQEGPIWKFTINPVLSPEGKIARLFITIADISEQKRIKVSLDENKTRFNQALESARAGVWEWDLTTNETSWSDQIWPLYGLKSGNAAPPSFQLWASVIHPDDRVSTINTVTEAAKCETVMNVEYRVCYPDGSTHWMISRGKPFHDLNGRVARYIGTTIDITERKIAEQALVSSEKKFRSMAEQIAEIVFITDQYGIVNYVSPAVDPISGYTTDEVIGHPFVEFVFEEDIERAVSSFQLGLSGKDSDEMLELRYQKKDGSLFYAEIHVQYYQ